MADEIEVKRRLVVSTTSGLIRMAIWAMENKMNRHIPLEKLREFRGKVDEKGIHLCIASFPHNHRMGEPIAEHIRSMWLCKMKDSDIPTEVTLDIDVDLFTSNTSEAIMSSSGQYWVEIDGITHF